MHTHSQTSFFQSQKITTLFICCLLFLSVSFSSYSATFKVTNLNDSGNGSFRQAVLDANNQAGFDNIIFTVNGTIQLKTHIWIRDAVLIDGLTAPNSSASSPSVALEYLYAPIYIHSTHDVTLRGLQIINPDLKPLYDGVVVENSSNIIIENMIIHLRKSAILGMNVRDIQIVGNDLRDSGFELGTGTSQKGAAIKLQNVTAQNLVGGVSIYKNQVGVYRHQPNQVLRIENARNITISGVNQGANIVMYNSQLGVSNPFFLSKIGNLKINSVQSISNDYPNAHTGIAFEIENSETITISQNVVLGREAAIKTNTTTDLIINKNDFRDCGGNNLISALILENVKALRLVGGLEIRGNEFGKDNYDSYGILSLKGASNITISNPSNTQANISLNESGLDSPFPLILENIEKLVVEDIDLSFSPSEYGVNNGIALKIENSTDVSVVNIAARKRWTALQANYITDLYVVKNDFVDSGLEKNNVIHAALHLNSISQKNLPRGLFVADNRFGKEELNPKRILYLYPTEQTYITNPSLGGNIQLNQSGLDLENPLFLVANNHLEVQGLEFRREEKLKKSCAIEVERYTYLFDREVNIYYNSFVAWDRAIKISNIYDSYNYFGCNTFLENQIGVEVTNSVISLKWNNFIRNRYAVVNNGNFVFYASQNYWGTSDGSSTDGGSDDAYLGKILATQMIFEELSTCAPEFKIKGENTVNTKDVLSKKVNSASNEIENLVQIYPNPTKGIVNFRLSSSKTTENEQVQIRIIDALGRIVNTTNSQSNSELKVDLTNQKAGIYFVEILVGKERYTQKIIKE